MAISVFVLSQWFLLPRFLYHVTFYLLRGKGGKRSLPSEFISKLSIGSLQLAIHVVHNRHAGEQKSHCDSTNKRQT